MNYNLILYGGIWHAISATKCVQSKMTSIIAGIVHNFPIKQHLGKFLFQYCMSCCK
jgi:hypothetical protein